jgi:hypothetical protein
VLADTGRRVLGAVLTYLLLLVLSGCAPQLSVPTQPAGREPQAEAIVAEWLSSMAAGDAARAWELMHPVTRRDVYRGLQPDFTHDVVSAQGRFFWAVQPANFFDVHYLVDLRLANGLGATPRFLIDRGLIHTHEVGDALVPYVVVRIDEHGEDGVLSNG